MSKSKSAAPAGVAPAAEATPAGQPPAPKALEDKMFQAPAAEAPEASPATAPEAKPEAAPAKDEEIENPFAEPASGDAKKDGEQGTGNAEGAQAAYEFTLPEGYTVGDDQQKAFVDVLSKHEAKPELAQDLVDLVIRRDADLAKQQANEFLELRKGMLAESKADPDIGGARWEETCRLARIGAMAKGGQELIDLFDMAGISQHRLVLGLMSWVGEQHAEDQLVVAGATKEPPAPKPLEDRMFKDSAKEYTSV